MCLCTPAIRTPYCGRHGCEWPHKRHQHARTPGLSHEDINAIGRAAVARENIERDRALASKVQITAYKLTANMNQPPLFLYGFIEW
jgi:hypothetical protein